MNDLLAKAKGKRKPDVAPTDPALHPSAAFCTQMHPM